MQRDVSVGFSSLFCPPLLSFLPFLLPRPRGGKLHKSGYYGGAATLKQRETGNAVGVGNYSSRIIKTNRVDF